MKIKNIKINKFFYKKSSKRGIALLFSIMLSTIFLTIATGVINIAVKELNFNTSTLNSNNAFYAADTGVECALYLDKGASGVFTGGSVDGSNTCFGVSNNIVRSGTLTITTTFYFSGLGSNSTSCVKVTVEKTPDGGGYNTVITSKGYNRGNIDCSSGDIERVLQVSY